MVEIAWSWSYFNSFSVFFKVVLTNYVIIRLGSSYRVQGSNCGSAESRSVNNYHPNDPTGRTHGKITDEAFGFRFGIYDAVNLAQRDAVL